MMAIAKSLSQVKTFPTMSTSQFRGLVLLFSFRGTKWLFGIITSDESISSLVWKQTRRMCMGNFATLQLLWAASSVTNPDFFGTVYFCYTNWFRPHETSESTYRSRIFLKALSSVDSFLDPTDLVNSCGRLKAWNFWIQQRPKLAPKLKWKLANSKWQHYRLLTCIF